MHRALGAIFIVLQETLLAMNSALDAIYIVGSLDVVCNCEGAPAHGMRTSWSRRRRQRSADRRVVLSEAIPHEHLEVTPGSDSQTAWKGGMIVVNVVEVILLNMVQQ